ncbi:MAG TPA: DUF819 family protein [Draconibacterium sp.]|nr:DUF819 family protein [Draconibacterium sp.]
MHSFISPDNNLVLLLIITGAAAFGIYSEHKKWFGKVSGILVTMISMSVLSMTGIIPVASNPKMKVDVYNMVFDYFIPIAIPLMLFSSNLGKIIRESGKLLLAYIIGATGVVLGSILAFKLIDLGAGSADTAGIIVATLIGGSLNFVTTAEILNFSTNPLFTATLAIDNVVANLYVLLLFLVPSINFLSIFFSKQKVEKEFDNAEDEKSEKKTEITLERLALSLFIAVFIAGAGTLISPVFQKLFKTELNLSILIITILSIVAANVFPKALKKLENTAFSIGLWMMYIFLAVIGAASNLQDILHVGFPVFMFYLIIMLFHFIFLLALARLFKLDVYEVIVSSAANIMGPSVAAPMAASLGQRKLITPGILTGILGYIIGTFIGVSIALFLG